MSKYARQNFTGTQVFKTDRFVNFGIYLYHLAILKAEAAQVFSHAVWSAMPKNWNNRNQMRSQLGHTSWQMLIWKPGCDIFRHWHVIHSCILCIYLKIIEFGHVWMKIFHHFRFVHQPMATAWSPASHSRLGKNTNSIGLLEHAKRIAKFHTWQI